MTTLEERIRWVLRERGLTQRALSMGAGLNETHVSTLLTRLKKDPERTVDSATLAKLARAGQVSVRWLVLGEGDPNEPPSVLRDYPGWAEALAVAKSHAAGIPDAMWEMAGACTVPTAVVDWELVVGIARELYSHVMRAQESAKGSSPEEPPPSAAPPTEPRPPPFESGEMKRVPGPGPAPDEPVRGRKSAG